MPTFAVGRDLTKPAWGAVFRQMMGRDLVRPDPDRHGALRMTDAARPILRGEASITLRAIPSQSAGPGPPSRRWWRDEDAPLLSALKAKRRALAEAQGVPAYVVFPDRTLIEMAETPPARRWTRWRASPGSARRSWKAIGAAFLEVITGADRIPLHPAADEAGGARGGRAVRPAGRGAAGPRARRGRDGQVSDLHPFSTLRKIAEARPSTLAELEQIAGLGPQKIERFGPAFLDAIRDG